MAHMFFKAHKAIFNIKYGIKNNHVWFEARLNSQSKL